MIRNHLIWHKCCSTLIQTPERLKIQHLFIMRIKQLIIIGLLFNGLAGLIAVILSQDTSWYRTVNTTERLVLGTPETEKDKARYICYVETHQVYMKTPAQSLDDELLMEFIPGGFFDELYDRGIVALIANFVRELNHMTQAQQLINLWFIRKRIDEGCDFAANDIMLGNMWFFWKSYSLIVGTIGKAEIIAGCQGFSLGCDQTNLDCIQTAFACVDDANYLDYPEAIASLMHE